MYIDIEEKVNQLKNNDKVQKFLLEFNKKHFVPDDQLFGYPIIDTEQYLLFMQLGIPIGLIKPIDSNGNDVFEWSDIPDEEIIRWQYTPINSFEDLEKNKDYHLYLDFHVNYKFLPKEKIQHLAYCLKFSNSTEFFDIDTINQMQSEIIDSAPLKYDRAMEIFNKYYNVEVHKKFIVDHNVSVDRFYEISGLNKLDIDGFELYNNVKI